MDTLKPCPFCGGSVSIQRMIGTWYENGEETEYDSYQWAILHNKWFTSRCPADTFAEHESFRTLECSEADAQKQRLIQAWNTRAQTVFGITLDEVRQMMKRDAERGLTCHLEAVDKGYSIAPTCSECGYEWVQFSYCPNCGARVIEGKGRRDA